MNRFRVAVVLALVCVAPSGIAQSTPEPDPAAQRTLLTNAIARLQAQIADTDTSDKDRQAYKRILTQIKRLRDPVGFQIEECTESPKVFDSAIEIRKDTLYSCREIHFRASANVRVVDATVFFRTDKVVIDSGAIIDARGDAGAQGPRGADAGPPWQSQGDWDYWDAIRSCRANPDSSERGRPGGTGERGSAAGRLIFAPVYRGVDPPIDGGAGGPGGPGGTGRLLKNGRNNYCDGCMAHCPSGPQGGTGPRGEDGFTYTLADRF